MKELNKTYLLYAGCLLVAFFPFFCNLDAIPMQLWDESRLANHVAEMLRSKNWIITEYLGQPDMWMTKPLLMVWLQILFTKIVGINELAIRLPSALAAVGTCLCIFYLFSRKLKLPLPGIIAVFVLVTTQGYVILHGTRTGEYDSLLTFFMMAYAGSFFLYCYEKKPGFLSWTFAFLTLAAYTKGIQGLMFIPAIVAYAFYEKVVWSIIRERRFYTGLASFIILVSGYYLLREHYNHGYIKTVWQNEIGGRYSTVIENHGGDGLFYIDLLINDHLKYWYLLVIPGFFAGIYSKLGNLKRITVFAGLYALIYLVIISCAKTKAYWYLLPVYPFLAILVSVFLYTIYMIVDKIKIISEVMTRNIFPVVFLILIFLFPYKEIVVYDLADKGDIYQTEDRNNFQLFLKDVLHHDKNVDGCDFLDDGFQQDIFWYFLVFNLEHRPINYVSRNNINPQGKLIVFLPDSKKFLEETYNAICLKTDRNMVTYQLNGVKK